MTSIRSHTSSRIRAAICLALLFSAAACSANDNSFEDAGESVDDAIEDAGDEIEEATD